MKNFLFAVLAMLLGNVFASSEVDQAAGKAAMNECLKTKTQQECNDIQKASQKAVSATKNSTSSQ